MARNKFMVDNSDLMICFFSGAEGGTMDTVNYANEREIKVINILQNFL